jgi:adenosylhomocysteine nucleosidase
MTHLNQSDTGNKGRRLSPILFALFCFVVATLLMRPWQRTEAADKPADATPRLGLLVPVHPKDYSLIINEMKDRKTEKFGPFSYEIGTINGVPVVVSIAPMDGPLMRSLTAQDMVYRYNIRAFLYPGTSGAHLGPDQMRVGDVVLGAENVDFNNYFMSKSGDVIAHEFSHEENGEFRYDRLYLDPQLLAKLACSANRVSAQATLPRWINPKYERVHPDVFYYGIQGTTTVWLGNIELMDKLHAVFGEMDEDGDWYSNLVATMYGIPFIEVSTITDSIKEFPETERGIPPKPNNVVVKANQVGQDVSNKIILDLIAHEGGSILAGNFNAPTTNPYEVGLFKNPKQPASLLQQGGCQK